MINVFQPSLGEQELQAVRAVFASNWLGKGKLTEEFEARFARYLGADREQLRSISCCTEGLFQAMRLLDIGPGDEVVLPSLSFVGAANAVAAAGAKPVFADVDRRTLNITAKLLEPKITDKTRAALLLHYGGLPCEMDPVCSLLQSKSLPLIEDSACSVASRYKGKACGTFGEIATWSFDSMKILVCGDGGMLYCRDPKFSQRAEQEIYLGLTSNSGLASPLQTKWWQFEISCFGRRAVINDITAAIGLTQLDRLPDFIQARKAIHEYYDRELAGVEWMTLPPRFPDYISSSYYFYWVQTARPQMRDGLATWLRNKGIYTTFRYYPLHLVKHYRSDASLPNSEAVAGNTLCIPIHQSLSDEDIARIVESIHEFGKQL